MEVSVAMSRYIESVLAGERAVIARLAGWLLITAIAWTCGAWGASSAAWAEEATDWTVAGASGQAQLKQSGAALRGVEEGDILRPGGQLETGFDGQIILRIRQLGAQHERERGIGCETERTRQWKQRYAKDKGHVPLAAR